MRHRHAQDEIAAIGGELAPDYLGEADDHPQREIAGRNTSGVMILRVSKGEPVVPVAKIDESENVEVQGLDEVDGPDDAVAGEDPAAGSDE